MTADLDKAVKSAVWITAANLAATASGVFFWAAAAALAGREGLGAAAYEIAVANTAATLLNLGLQQYTLRFVKTERGKALGRLELPSGKDPVIATENAPGAPLYS